jgi:hypothetical protein
MDFDRPLQVAFHAACVAHAVGLDDEHAIEIEKFEIASMQRLHAHGRIARETELEQFFAAQRQYVDECFALAAGTPPVEVWINSQWMSPNLAAAQQGNRCNGRR